MNNTNTTCDSFQQPNTVAIAFKATLTDKEKKSRLGLFFDGNCLIAGTGNSPLSDYVDDPEALHWLTRSGSDVPQKELVILLDPNTVYADLCDLNIPVNRKMLDLYCDLHSAYRQLHRLSYMASVVPVGSNIPGSYRLYLYEQYALSGGGFVFLTPTQISRFWNVDTCHKVLKYEGKTVTFLAHALCNTWARLRENESMGNDYNHWRYWLVRSDQLPPSYLEEESAKAEKIGFYPYHVLRDLGFPLIKKLDAIENQSKKA